MVKPPLNDDQLKDPKKLREIRNKGSIIFWLNDANRDWATSADTYVFPPVSKGGITVNCVKRPNKTIDITIDGPFNKKYVFNAKIPPCTPKGLMVGIVWEKPTVILRLNAQTAQTVQA